MFSALPPIATGKRTLREVGVGPTTDIVPMVGTAGTPHNCDLVPTRLPKVW
jgi:hypothetical protein